MQFGRTALIQAASHVKTSCLSALIQAKADINHEDNVRLGANVVLVLLWGPHDAMSTHVLNVSPFDLPIRMHVEWSHSPDISCFSWED